MYNLFKFVHIAAVIVWIGGLVTIGIINARLAREQDPAARAFLTRASGFFGRAIFGPATLLTLAAGIAMVAVSSLSFTTVWIAWGLTGIFVSLVLGVVLIRRAGEQLSTAIEEAQPDSLRIVALQRRLRMLNILNLLVLFSVVWAMVFKPTL